MGVKETLTQRSQYFLLIIDTTVPHSTVPTLCLICLQTFSCSLPCINSYSHLTTSLSIRVNPTQMLAPSGFQRPSWYRSLQPTLNYPGARLAHQALAYLLAFLWTMPITVSLIVGLIPPLISPTYSSSWKERISPHPALHFTTPFSCFIANLWMNVTSDQYRL